MKDSSMSRRDVVTGIAASVLAALDATQAIGQTGESLVSISEVAKRLKLLETEAATTNLLPERRGPLPSLTTQNVYLEGLPRLVELVNRAVSRRPQLADQAALLLSEINMREAVPAAFYSQIGLKGPSPSFQSVEGEYLRLFQKMSVRSEHVSRVRWYADMLTANKERYETVSAQTSVPWYVIGAMHALEASFNFLAHIHNGDVPLDHQTKHVPEGQPHPWTPPFTWERSAENALRLEHLAGSIDWSLPRTLYRLESYNGFGYRARHVNSPYLWSFSYQYDQGKFVRDGVWSPTTKSQQCGAAVMIHELAERGLITI